MKQHLKKAQEHVESLKKDLAENPGGMSKQQAAAKKRGAEQAVERTTHAIEQLKKLRRQKETEAKKREGLFRKKTKPMLGRLKPIQRQEL